MGKVITAHTPDGVDIVSSIRELLRDQPLEMREGLDHSLKPWDDVVVLFVLTPDLLKNRSCIDYAKWVVEQDIPLVPVVEDITAYDFKSLPKALGVLWQRNARGIKPSLGPSLLETVQAYLGLAPLVYKRKVFISYNRSDGIEPAQKIYEFLMGQGYAVFMDLYLIEGGAVVQDRIKWEISDKDMVLLVDSPEAALSDWVKAEIIEAGARRVPICVVLTTDKLNLQLVRDFKRISWDASDPDNLERVRIMVARGIASRDLLDRKIARTLQKLVKRKNLKLRDVDKRRVILSGGTKRLVLEYEDSAISLERLHRLYLGYKKQKRCNGAIFVGGDQPVLELTREAVLWARGRSALEVLSLADLYAALDQLF